MDLVARVPARRRRGPAMACMACSLTGSRSAHQPPDLILVESASFEAPHDLALIDHRDSIAQEKQLVQVFGQQERRRALLLPLEQLGIDKLHGGYVQPPRRIVR